MFGPKEMHKAVAKGQVDIGVVLQPAMLAMVPMLQGAYLPFAFDSIDEAAKAYEGESLAIIEKAMEAKHIKLIYTSFTDGVQLYSNKGNIKSIDDFNPYLKKINDYGIKDKVLMDISYIPYKKFGEYFAKADIVVLPYRKVYQSGVLQLAYGFGKPVVVTNTGGLPEAALAPVPSLLPIPAFQGARPSSPLWGTTRR